MNPRRESPRPGAKAGRDVLQQHEVAHAVTAEPGPLSDSANQLERFGGLESRCRSALPRECFERAR